MLEYCDLRYQIESMISYLSHTGQQENITNCLTKYLTRKNTMEKNTATRISNSATEIRDEMAITMRVAKLAGAASRARPAGIASRQWDFLESYSCIHAATCQC